ncbi:uncharacterized protein DMENIID0001_161310 [Sergentomyia squamirostris]
MEKMWNIPPFKCVDVPASEQRTKWIQWKSGFENLMSYSEEKDGKKLRSLLLLYGGFELNDVLRSIPGGFVETDDKNVNVFEVAMKKLDEYFMPKRHESYERYLWWTLQPETDEPLEKFMLRIQHRAHKCNFGKSETEAREGCIIDKIIQSAPQKLREKLLEKDGLSLDEVTKMVNTHQAMIAQAKDFEKKNNMNQSLSGTSTFDGNVNAIQRKQFHARKREECSRCGREGHAGDDPKCPALREKCSKCNLKGHFARKCRTQGSMKRSLQGGSNGAPRTKFRRIQAITENTEQENEEQDTEPKFIFNVGEGDELLWCKIGGVLIEMLIDSGSSQNIIDLQTWNYLKKNGVKVHQMDDTVKKDLRAYAQSNPLEIVGSFEATITVSDVNEEYSAEAKFYVVKDGERSLLGKKTALALRVLILGLPSMRNEVHNIQDGQKKVPFPKIKGIQLRIPIDKEVTPVCQHARRPPIALLSKIEERLNEYVDTDITEKVNEPSEWVSPMLPLPKGVDDVRICVDMRQANKAVKRENHLMPTFDDFLPRLTGASKFSRLDVKDAYHQIELHPDCRHITTFITHKGMYRFKRLMFGLSCAPEMFQKIMEQILSPIPNAMNYLDDIIVFGKDLEEHDRTLKLTLQTLEEAGVLLNAAKCVFRTSQIEFLGHIISNKGVQPTESKVEAIQGFRAPESKEEIRSFLGLVTYVGRYLPNLATITFPLRNLMCGEERFVWKEEHSRAFEVLKKLIGDAQTLSFFDNKLRTRVIADASPVALGAVLVQFDKQDEPRIIGYASKSLTETERRYCQTEKEALALVWAVERFSIYLVGREFELETDHKPLEVIFKPTTKACARIERWLLRMQSFRFKVIYKKGSSNVADALSRLSKLGPSTDFEPESVYFVRAIIESAAIDVTEIEMESKADDELTMVRECVENGTWHKSEIKQYAPFGPEIGSIGDLLIRGTKVIIPRKLRSRMLNLAHEGHPGEIAMKQRLRDRVWWPGMDAEAAKVVQKCEGCRLVAAPSKPEPMQRRALPEGPWIDIAIDFLGPLPSGDYLLVIIDYFSRYKEVEVMRSISAKDTVIRLDRIFTRLGYPRTISLDNAKQFISEEFTSYCSEKCIELNNTIPYWPQQNGEVERQNRSLLKRLRISNALNQDWKADLQKYLMMYYTTPHATTGKTPTELCYGRTIRSKIPSLGDLATVPPSSEMRDRDQMKKRKGKEVEDARRGAKSSEIKEGDVVLMKNLLPGNKVFL